MDLSLIISLIALLVSLCVLRWYRYHYLAEMWYEIKKVTMDHPAFTDIEKTKNYKTSFSGEDALKYNTFAELCWGYAEDLWINRYAKKKFYKPSLEKFKSLHYEWLMDNKNAYNPKMVKFISKLQNV